MKNKYKKGFPYLLLIALFFFYPHKTEASASTVNIGNYLNYLDQSIELHVNGVVEDNYGFLWFATQRSVDRYDGKNITRYYLVDPYYPEDYQQTIDEKFILTDKNKDIWVSTYSGKIYRYDLNMDKFILEIDLREILSQPYVGTTTMHFVDNLLLIASQNAILQYDCITKKLSPLYSGKGMKVSSFIQERERTYVCSLQGVHTFAKSNGQLHLQEDTLANTLMNLSAKSFFITSNPDRVFVIKNNTDIVIWDRKEEKIIQTLSLNNPIKFISEYEGNIYISTDGGGLFVMNPEELTFLNRNEEFVKEPVAIIPDYVNHIFVDSGSRLWLSTYFYVSFYNPLQIKWKYIYPHPEDSDKRMTYNLHAMLKVSEDKIWCATNYGIGIYDSRQNQWKHIFLNGEGQDSKRFLSPAYLIEANNNEIWLSGFNMGIYVFDRDTQRIKYHYTSVNSNLTTNTLYALFKDKNGDIWMGGRGGTLCKYDFRLKDFIAYPLVEEVNFITEKNDEELYIGLSYGLISLNKETGTPQMILEENLTNVRYRRPAVNHLLKDEDLLYIATESDGLIILNITDNSWKQYKTNSGLLSNSVRSIIKSQDNKIWLGLGEGIASFDPLNEKITNYSKLNGLKYTQFYQNAVIRIDNEILFSAQGNIVLFNPELMSVPSLESELLLTDFKLFDVKLTSDDPDSPLKRSINETEEIKLPYNKNYFTVNYTAINFDTPDKVLYTCYLEGHDKMWQSGSSIGEADYKNVSPGRYTLYLKAYNSEDQQLIDERSLNLIISQPFWLSTWAWCIYLSIIFIILFLSIRSYHAYSERKRSETMVNFFRFITHDIRLPLSLIKSPIQELDQKGWILPEGRDYIDFVHKNIARLEHLTSQLLDFQYSQTYNLKMTYSECDIPEFIQRQIINFNAEIEKKNLQISYQIPEKALITYTDEDKLKSIIDNLLSNAIKYTPDKGRIDIEVTVNEKNWYFSIQDSGIGIPKDEQKKLFKYFFRASNAIESRESGSGIGLMIITNFTRLMGGTISFKSVPKQGSFFKLTFPVKEKKDVHKETTPIYNVYDSFVTEQDDLSKEEDTRNNKIKVLLVDDDDDLRKFLSLTLSEDYTIMDVEDSTKVFSLAKKKNPDIIISDVMMPVMTGYELCNKLKNDIETSHIPIILLSALNTNKQMVEGYKALADAYITKPFSVEVLKSRINSMITIRDSLKNKYMRTIMEKTQENEVDPNDPNTLFLEKLQTFINDNISNTALDVNELAREMMMSRTGIYNKVSSLTGYTPIEFIRIIRMKEAVRLLKTNRYNVNEVSDMVGYADSKYFINSFKKFYGASPKKYITQLLKEDENELTT